MDNFHQQARAADSHAAYVTRHAETPVNTPRLKTLLERVRGVFEAQPGQYLSLDTITAIAGSNSTASISARIRDLRKAKHGALDIRVRRLYEGCYQYAYFLPTAQVL